MEPRAIFQAPVELLFSRQKKRLIIIGTTCIGFCAAAGEHTKVQFTVSYVHYRVTITPLYPIINYIPLYAIISYYIDVRTGRGGGRGGGTPFPFNIYNDITMRKVQRPQHRLFVLALTTTRKDAYIFRNSSESLGIGLVVEKAPIACMVITYNIAEYGYITG